MKFETIRRIMKQSTDRRVSEDSVKTLQTHLERELEEISQDAAKLTDHAGRKTIKEQDMQKAINDHK